MSHPKGYRRHEGAFNRSKMLSRLKRAARAKQPGAKPEPARRYTSAVIMAHAGEIGMLSVSRSRRLCGYRWATPSKYA